MSSPTSHPNPIPFTSNDAQLQAPLLESDEAATAGSSTVLGQKQSVGPVEKKSSLPRTPIDAIVTVKGNLILNKKRNIG